MSKNIALIGIVCLVTLGCHWAVLAQTKAAPAKPKGAGWQSIFDGRSFDNWTPEGEAKWRIANGVIVGDSGGDGWLRYNETLTDFVFTCQFRNISKGNSGVFFRARNEGKPYPAPEHGYELQINNEEPKYATGSIEDYVQRLKAMIPAPNQWHTYELTARGDHFIVRLDGVKVLDGKNDKFASGYLGLQYHKDSKIEFRNLRLKTITR